MILLLVIVIVIVTGIASVIIIVIPIVVVRVVMRTQQYYIDDSNDESTDSNDSNTKRHITYFHYTLLIFYDNLKNTTYMHFLVTEGHISTCHFQVDALSNHKMVLVAAGEAHSGAVDMNGSLEQRFRVFHDVFRWVLDKLGILVRKHIESVAVFGRLQEDFFVKS